MNDEMHDENGVHGTKGGVARAQSLTPSKRREIATNAAKSRWDLSIPVAEHGSPDSPLRIGGLALPCYVLTGGIRVFSQRGLIEALGLRVRGSEIERLVSGANLQRYLSAEALYELGNPLRFRRPSGGPLLTGYPVTLLIDVCNAVLDAFRKGELPKHFEMVAARSDVIIRAVAKVGIIALVDEATGYDQNREETLQAILDLFIRKELAAWMKRFPDEYYQQISRLRGWKWSGRPGPTPWAVARITADLVYARLAPGILPELERVNPRIEKRRRGKHHQFLTDDVGHPALAQHLHTIISFMRVSDSWDQLQRMVDKALPRQDDIEQLHLWESPAGG